MTVKERSDGEAWCKPGMAFTYLFSASNLGALNPTGSTYFFSSNYKDLKM